MERASSCEIWGYDYSINSILAPNRPIPAYQTGHANTPVLVTSGDLRSPTIRNQGIVLISNPTRSAVRTITTTSTTPSSGLLDPNGACSVFYSPPSRKTDNIKDTRSLNSQDRPTSSVTYDVPRRKHRARRASRPDPA